MEEKIKEIYRMGFVNLFESVIDLTKYDKEFEVSKLYINPSMNQKGKVINSKYFNLLNNFYIDKLSNDDKVVLGNSSSIDNQVLDIVRRTYKEVLKNGDKENIMYNPPMPDRLVKNGSLVLEFVFGKTGVDMEEEEYVELIKKQKEYIKTTNDKLIKDVEEKLGVPCNIFIDKRV